MFYIVLSILYVFLLFTLLIIPPSPASLAPNRVSLNTNLYSLRDTSPIDT